MMKILQAFLLFAISTLLLGTVAYVLKAQDLGASLSETFIVMGIFSAIGTVVRYIISEDD